MAITTPEFYDLKTFKCDSPSLSDQIFPYAIGFTKGDGIWWSAVLSFLFPVKDITDFKVRVSKLCRDENQSLMTISRKESEDLYDFLEKYNPFRNRYSCFHNDTLKRLVRKFEKYIFGIVSGGAKKFNSSKPKRIIPARYENCDVYLETISSVLNSDIALCDVLTENVKYFRFSSDETFSECALLTLYTRSEGNDKSNKIFCFGIERKMGIKLQKIALRSILSAAKLYPKNVQHILDSVSTNNITLTLVNQNMYSEIFVLFKQPHILFKLEEAGYKINPVIPDDQGNSALYYALETKNENIVHQFYNYLSGAVQLSGISPRNPEHSILENLENLKSILNEHKSKFENKKSRAASVFLEQLIKFNSFQAAIVTELLKTENVDDVPPLPHAHGEVEKRKRKIIAILSTYLGYFNFEDTLASDHNNHNSAETSDLEEFIVRQKSFEKYTKYHQILDFNAALFFFDNLFSLKENLKLTNNAYYEIIESAFLRFILVSSFHSSSKYFPSNYSMKKIRKPKETDTFQASKALCYRAVFMERSKLKTNLAEFKDLLTTTSVNKENVRTSVSESDLETVTSLPNIRDAIVFRAMLHYLDVVSNIEMADDVKAILVIERALQVIGEALNERTAGSISLGKSLLGSALPVTVRKNLRDIRDKLSHADGKNVEGRKRIESCKEIFEGIKCELCAIKSQIERNHRMLELLAAKYIFQVGRLHRKEIHAMIRKDKNLVNGCSRQLVIKLSKSIKSERRYVGFVMCNIRNEISFFSHHSNLKIHFDHINYYMFETQNVSKTDRLAKVEFHLGCMKSLFSHFFKEVRKESDTEKELTGTINEIETLAKKFFVERKPFKESAQKTMTEKEELVMGKYEEIYKKNLQNKKLKHGKRNIGKSRRRTKHLALTKKSQIVHLNGRYSIQSEAVSSLPITESHFREKGDSDAHSDEVEETSEEIYEYPFIGRLTEALNYFYPITAEEKHFIIDQVPLKFKEHSKAKTGLLRIFEEMQCEQDIAETEVRALIQELLPSKNRNELQNDFISVNLLETNIDTLKSIKDYYGDMILKLDNNDLIDGAEFVQYVSNLELQSEGKELLRQCVKGETLKVKNYVVLNYLVDKVSALENLLIKSDPTIDRMWPQVKSSKTRQHIIYRIKERYIRDPKVQAAVEMLLFDCANILKRRADLRRLWIKASSLFNGINLRNVLAHGNPLFEEVGRILDPDDLPSEIVSKCLELVDDKNVVKAMSDLFGKIGGAREDFVAAVKDRNEHVDLCDAITRGAKWESYASLIPKRP